MRIVYIANEIPYPPINGGQMRSWNILKNLSKSHQIIFVCFGKGESQIPEAFRRNISVKAIDRPVMAQGRWQSYWRLILGLFYRYPRGLREKTSEVINQFVSRLIRDDQVDLIFCDTINYSLNVPLVCKKTIINEHNLESKLVERLIDFNKSPILRFFMRDQMKKLRRYENQVWPRFNRVFMCSEQDAAEAAEQCGHAAKFVVIPNGVDVEAFVPGTGEVISNRLVFTGEMGYQPNEDAMLHFVKDIYPQIKIKNPAVQLDVVGRNPSPHVVELGQQDPSIRVTGFVQDVRGYVRAGAVYIVPLRIGSGTRLKILEAMAMGKAIVSTRVGAEGLEVTDGQDILLADEPQDFADKVVRLLNDPAEARRLGQSGRRLVEQKYSWDMIGERIEQEIQEVMNE